MLVRILNQHEFRRLQAGLPLYRHRHCLAAFSVGVSAFYYMPRQPQRGGQIALNILVYNLIVGIVPLLLLLCSIRNSLTCSSAAAICNPMR